MRSMTGYGRASAEIDGRVLTIEATSGNRRSLDVTVSLPAGWEGLEAAVGERVRRVASRGKIHVEGRLEAAPAGDPSAWDEPAVRAALGRLEALAASQGVAFRPTPELLWQVASSLRAPASRPATEDSKARILETVEEALHNLAVMRAKEGEALLIEFLARAAALRRQIEAIAGRAPQVAPAYREALFRRLREAGLELDLGDERVLREIALFADRCDVSEEITRFRSHLEQLTALLRSEDEIGRKAEFLLQEMMREAHTVGSKSNDLQIARHVIELKNELEKVREQMANVE